MMTWLNQYEEQLQTSMLQGLAQYGNGFLAKFEAASCANKLLEEVTLVDTPGVLSGEKQRIERTYNFIDVCGWFAARCDLILLLFDPHKLDISDEFKQVCSCHVLNAEQLAMYRQPGQLATWMMLWRLAIYRWPGQLAKCMGPGQLANQFLLWQLAMSARPGQ